MARLAVMAHFDHAGAVAPHARRQVEALARSVEDLVVVTTADLREESRRWLSARARLVERENVGYDFLSYKVGLASTSLAAYDEVLICNDSYVPAVDDYRGVLDSMAGSPADFWGLAESDRIKHHVQSFFVAFRRSALDSAAFREFWDTMEPLSDRMKVIRRHEIGLSRRLYDAGLTSAPYFTETPADRRLARRRVAWWAVHRGTVRGREDLRRFRRQVRAPWNPSIALADRVLDGARLPYAKIDTLRYDPYGLGAPGLLAACEAAMPDRFEGVAAWLRETAGHYPGRPQERLRPTPTWAAPLRPLVRYRAAS